MFSILTDSWQNSPKEQIPKTEKHLPVISSISIAARVEKEITSGC
jgi:hypothetical protein